MLGVRPAIKLWSHLLMVDERANCAVSHRKFCKFVQSKLSNDKTHLIFSATLMILGGLSLIINISLVSILFSLVAIFLSDVYAFAVIFIAAKRSDGKWPCTENILPTRTGGVFVAFSLLLAIIFGFGGMYLNTCSIGAEIGCCLTKPLDALYFSSVTITTLGYGDYSPIHSTGKWLVIAELGSGLLLLFCIFPLLISRLSKF